MPRFSRPKLPSCDGWKGILADAEGFSPGATPTSGRKTDTNLQLLIIGELRRVKHG
ncbi:hypothetical protein G3572_09140 [Rhodobacter sp. ETT8]|uniref:Uncharacterized protein n=1 Tax=Pseudotabrizicola algicola TaxID=2709381 RepID=A0A6B3RLQ1_9RHOB|nr:hypothetical protein [Pseudotabrizicola algicola]